MKKQIFTAALAAFAALAPAAEKTELPQRWQYQPATDSKTLPEKTKWSLPAGGYKQAKLPKKQQWKQKIAAADNIWMRQEFTLPEQQKNDRFVLDFERINGNAIVFVNGKKVGERLGPYGTLEITKFVKPGRNELLLFNTRNYTDVSRTFETDPLRYTARGPGALYGELPVKQWALGIDHVNLIRLPVPAAVSDAWAETSWTNRELTLHLELDTAKALSGATVVCDILDAQGRKVLSLEQKNLNLKQGIETISLRKKWENPILWELDRGYLYTADIKLKNASGKLLDTQKFRFGFREIRVEGRDLILNGHKSRWRTEWSQFGITEYSVGLFKLLGRNMIYYQSNPTGWWRNWPNEVFHYDQKELDLMDREGIAVLLPVPSCNFVRERFFSDPKVRKQYEEETAQFIKRYRNHPSIIAWCTSMNSFNPRSGLHPDTFGKRENYTHIQAKVLNESFKIVKSIDKTRLVYGHAEGNLGDIASGNTYPNFAPLQEVEDWPELWAKHGNMPWWACEYAAVYDGSYFKGKQFLLTEYAAINLGKDAYRLETGKQLERTRDLGLENSGHGGGMVAVSRYAPLYFLVQGSYIKATDRAWRTWGIAGWHYFNFGVGYGEPPELKGRKRPFGRYFAMKKSVSGRPAWANELFDLHSKYMQPLLTYIAGSPVHTDKTHSFQAGDRVRKQIAAVWDGPGDLTLDLSWTLQDKSGKTVASGKGTLPLKAGDIKFLSVEFRAPSVKSVSEYTLKMSAKGFRDKPVTDSFALEIYPRTAPIPAQKRVVVYDPSGKSLPWIRSVLSKTTVYKPGMKWNSGDVLVMGRESVKPEMKLPFSAQDVKNGLRVLFLEQRPEIWEAMGFRTMDTGSRVVFFGSDPGTLRTGLPEQGLRYWSGTPDLLPEFKHARAYDVTVAPKSSNRNTVASSVIETPVSAGFVPLLSAEFDMDYTPLLRMNYGRGMILFSTLDFSGREGKDPAAMTLGKNLLRYAEQAVNPDGDVLVVYGSDEKQKAQISRILNAGGTVVYVGLDAKQLAAKGITSEKKEIRRVAFPETGIFAKLFPWNLLRWRDLLTVNAITSSKWKGEIGCDGIFLLRKNGKGRELFLQVSPAMLENRYKDPAKQESIQLSVLRLKQLVNRAATAFGAEASDELAARVTKVKKGATFQNLDSWFVFGPFYAGRKTKPADALAREWPGEKQALSGDMNPNLTYRTEDGRTLDFRKTVSANPDGFNDLGRTFESNRSDAVGYAIKTIRSDSDRKAMLRLGVDYFFRVYVNGKLVFERTENHGAPKPNIFRLRIDLKKGDNVIVMKIYTGSKGFGFWSNLSEPGVDFSKIDAEKDRELIYDPEIKIRNPYEFYYW